MTVEPDDTEDFDALVDDDDNDDDYTPPSREEFERVKRALAKANSEAKKNRLKLKDFLKTPDGKSGEDGKDGKKTEIDRERVRAEVSEAEEAKWKKRVVRQAAQAELLKAGLQGDPKRLARLVDEDDVEVDDDGEVTDGLDDQIEQIKEDYPDLFKDENAPLPKARRTRIDAGGSQRPPQQRKLSSAERIQAQVMGKKVRSR